MLNGKRLAETIEFLLFAGFSASMLSGFYGWAGNDSRFSTAGTIGVCGTAYVWKKRSETDSENTTIKDLMESQDTMQRSLSESQTSLKDSDGNVQTCRNAIAYAKTTESAMKDNYDRLVERHNEAIKLHAEVKAQNDVLQPENTDLKSKAVVWGIQYAETLNDLTSKESEIEALKASMTGLQLDLMGYEAKFDCADEIAKLRAESEVVQLNNQIRDLTLTRDKFSASLQNTGHAYNQAIEQLKADHDSHIAETVEFKKVICEDLPAHFNTLMGGKDSELMHWFGRTNLLTQPQLFDAIGEFTRANLLIKSLWESESNICLDASEILPYADHTGFDLVLSQRDKKARGQAFIESLNEQGNALSVVCGCIKDLKFEYDRINPHRIKTSLVFRKKDRVDKASELTWIPSEQFSRVADLLKKPMTKIMGSTGEGKGIFANLLLAIEANQAKPAIVRLHDPMDNSSEDYWHVAKSSKGKDESLKAIKGFIKEFDARLDSGTSAPGLIDVFDEVDILADADSGINKALLNAAKGMRHNGMKAYMIGQSPSVGKKGFEWSDFDNFNCVYFGAAIVTALDKNPAISTKSEGLRKQYDKLKDYCDSQNDELSLEGWNEKRVGLLVTKGKADFFELPSADSIDCDWTKLHTSICEESATKTETNECLHLHSRVTKTLKNDDGVPIKKYRKCSDCETKFTETL
jgi:hypothetical protein